MKKGRPNPTVVNTIILAANTFLFLVPPGMVLESASCPFDKTHLSTTFSRWTERVWRGATRRGERSAARGAVRRSIDMARYRLWTRLPKR